MMLWRFLIAAVVVVSLLGAKLHGGTPASGALGLVLTFRALDSTGAPATLNFSQAAATQLDDYIGSFVQQHNYRQVSADGNWTVFFRPDVSGGRKEVVVEYGALLPTGGGSTAAIHQFDQFTATITQGGTTLSTILVDTQYWGTRWRWQSAPRPIIRQPSDFNGHAGNPKWMLPFDNSLTWGLGAFSTVYTYAGPMDISGLNSGGTGGERPDIGVLPQHEAAWMSNPSNSLAQQGSLAWAEGSGAMLLHFRDLGPNAISATGRWIDTRAVAPGFIQTSGTSTTLQSAPMPKSAPTSGTGAAPSAPTLTTTTGGTLLALQDTHGTFVTASVSYVYAGGESAASPDAWLDPTARGGPMTATNNLVTVHSPPPATGALGYHVYIIHTTFQGSSGNTNTHNPPASVAQHTVVPLPIGTDFTEAPVPAGFGGQGPMVNEACHTAQPSYVPFLMTDDPYLLEEVQALANWRIWSSSTTRGRYQTAFGTYLKGIWDSISTDAIPRCFGWGFRDIAYARIALESYPGTLPNWFMPKSYYDAITADELTLVNKYTTSPSKAFYGGGNGFGAFSDAQTMFMPYNDYAIGAVGVGIYSGLYGSGAAGGNWLPFFQYQLRWSAQFKDPANNQWCNQQTTFVGTNAYMSQHIPMTGTSQGGNVFENYDGHLDADLWADFPTIFAQQMANGDGGSVGPPLVTDLQSFSYPANVAGCNRSGPILRDIGDSDYYNIAQFAMHVGMVTGQSAIVGSANTYIDSKMPALMAFFPSPNANCGLNCADWKWSVPTTIP